MNEHKHTNRLSQETSPYLLQHAHNPVDWFPWGEEAFEKAKKEDKPVLLSIGYSACHWCHVMERETFENEALAEIMNRFFISIKVDREERPDLDGIYMHSVQMFTGSGGWPMTVFLTADGVPFYGGTYFPPEDRRGMPGFRRVLLTIAEQYKKDPRKIQQNAAAILKGLKKMDVFPQGGGSLSEALLERAYNKMAENFDRLHGGFGGAPKFPNPMSLSFLLRYFHRSHNQNALDMVEFTLREMAAGGIYDQLGGGFHRYAVDDHWLIPHFEKMLYDNALLISLYVDAYQISKNPFYKQIAQDSLDYVAREMTGKDGRFYSTQDADTEGAEGRFYVWSAGEIISLLGEKAGGLFCRFYGVTEGGNFEGKNVLTAALTGNQVAQQLGMQAGEVEAVIGEAKKKMMAAREARVKPGRDEKALAVWNGLMLAAFAKAARTWNRSDYLRIAENNGNFILSCLYRNGRLQHSYKDGRAKFNGFLDDYACVIDAFIELYQSSFDLKWLKRAMELTEAMLDLFWDEAGGAFFFTPKDHEKLIARMKDFYDGATPSGNSVAALALLRLAIITGREDYRKKAEIILASPSDMIAALPMAFSQLLCALDFHLAGPLEIVLAGERGDPAVEEFRKGLFNRYLPKAVVMLCDAESMEMQPPIPLLQGKTTINGKPALYVCRDYSCKEPLTRWEEMDSLL